MSLSNIELDALKQSLELIDEILEEARNDEWMPGALDGDDYIAIWEEQRDNLVKLYTSLKGT